MDIAQYLSDVFGPIIVELLAAFFVVAASFAMNALRKYIGDKNTKLLADLLHKAIESGVKSQMADGARIPDIIATAAVNYAEKSIPKTMAKLKPDHRVLIDIAKSKILDVLASGALK